MLTVKFNEETGLIEDEIYCNNDEIDILKKCCEMSGIQILEVKKIAELEKDGVDMPAVIRIGYMWVSEIFSLGLDVGRMREKRIKQND